MTAKEQVLKVYKDAWCDEFHRLDTLFRIKIKTGYISPDWDYTESAAWQSALTKINENKQHERH